MRFQQAYIFGFGKWVDQPIHLSSNDGIVSFYGENESGKSTLQQFLLYMLFDLPPRMRKFYQPKTSSKFGGQLTIVDEQNELFTIERTSDEFICLFPTGKTKDEIWFRSFMCGMSRDIYESIYAFSAEQLEGIRQMKESELSDVLFSVGITGAATIYETEKRLEKEMNQLFKPQGTKPIVNQQAKKVSQIEEDWQKQKDKEAQYTIWTEDKEQLTGALRNVEQEEQEVQQAFLFYKQMDHLLPDLISYHEHVDKLKHQETVRFPKQGIHRYESLKRELLPIQTKCDGIDHSLEKMIVKRRELEAHIAPESVYHEATQLMMQRQQYDEATNEIHRLSREIDQMQEEIADQTSMIDANVEQIISNRYPIQLQQEWQEIAQSQTDMNRQRKQFSAEEQMLKQQQETLKEQKQMALSHLFPPKELAEMKKKVEAYHDYQRIQQEEDVRQAAWSNFEAKRKTTARNVLVFSLCFGILLSISYFLFDSPLPLFAGVGIIVLGIIVYLTMHSTISQFQHVLQRNTIIDMPLSEAKLKEYVEKLHEQKKWEQRLDNIQVEQEKNEQQLFVMFNRLEQLDVDEQIRENEIEKQRKAYSVLAQIAPVHWPGMFETIQKIKAIATEKENKIQQQQMIRDQWNEWTNNLNRFSLYMENHESNTVTLTSLEKWILTYEQDKKQLAEMKQTEKELIEEQRQQTEQIQMLEKQINELFAYANVTDEESFYTVAHKFEEQQECESTINKFESHIEHAFPLQMQKRILHEQWSAQIIQLKLEKLERDKQVLSDKRRNYQKQLAELEHTIQEQEMSETLSTLTLTYEMEKESLHSLAEQWLIHKIAYDVLQQAKLNYQEKYLKQIIDLTTEYFAIMTGNHYVHIYPPANQKSFMVETTQGIRFDVTQLSKGTVDQLYIALRLAIGVVMSEKYDVPFIIDDAFVHFDDERTIAVIQVIRKIAETKQIILFTCHKDIAHLCDATNLEGSSIS